MAWVLVDVQNIFDDSKTDTTVPATVESQQLEAPENLIEIHDGTSAVKLKPRPKEKPSADKKTDSVASKPAATAKIAPKPKAKPKSIAAAPAPKKEEPKAEVKKEEPKPEPKVEAKK